MRDLTQPLSLPLPSLQLPTLRRRLARATQYALSTKLEAAACSHTCGGLGLPLAARLKLIV